MSTLPVKNISLQDLLHPAVLLASVLLFLSQLHPSQTVWAIQTQPVHAVMRATIEAQISAPATGESIQEQNYLWSNSRELALSQPSILDLHSQLWRNLEWEPRNKWGLPRVASTVACAVSSVLCGKALTEGWVTLPYGAQEEICMQRNWAIAQKI